MEPNFESMFEMAQARENGWMESCQSLESQLTEANDRIKELEGFQKRMEYSKERFCFLEKSANRISFLVKRPEKTFQIRNIIEDYLDNLLQGGE